MSGSLLLILLPLCATACAEPQARAESSVTDSAGVRVIENRAPSPQTPRITLAERADLVIGTQAGDSMVTLYRVQDAQLLSDGQIVVVNALDVLWFGPNGELRARSGGSGGGPTEFSALLPPLTVLPGDSVLAVNRRPPSGKIFDTDGELVRTFPLGPILTAGVRRLANGSWVGWAFDRATEYADAPVQPGFFREYELLTRHSPDMTVIDTIARLPGDMLYGTTQRRTRAPHSPHLHIAALGDRIVAGEGGTYELRVFDDSGQLRQVIRNSIADPPVASLRPEDTPVRRQLPAEPGTDPRRLESPMPESGPAFDQILLSTTGEIWVRRYATQDVDREWHVYDTDGQLSAVAQLPDAFRPTQIMDTHILGVWFDELDVESVRLYRYALTPAGQR